jgi:hypothetical protein
MKTKEVSTILGIFAHHKKTEKRTSCIDIVQLHGTYFSRASTDEKTTRLSKTTIKIISCFSSATILHLFLLSSSSTFRVLPKQQQSAAAHLPPYSPAYLLQKIEA